MMPVTLVVYKKIPRLSRECFDKVIKYFECCYPDVMIRPELVDGWYQSFIGFPDHHFLDAAKYWMRTNQYFPNHGSFYELLAQCFYPEIKYDIDPAATLAERERREFILSKFEKEDNGKAANHD